MEWLSTLIAPNVKALTPYESARRLFASADTQGHTRWMNANESPFSEDFGTGVPHLNRYPDCQPATLIHAYADYARVDKTQVLATRGADEGIELLIRTFCTPGQSRIMICPPTYGMYAISADTHNIGVDIVPLRQDFSLDLEAIKAHDPFNLVFLCSPNNPTGTLLKQSEVEAVLTFFAGKSLVVVDEAYIEFSPTFTWASMLNKYNNLVVLRTLSKAFALAGLRCGFTLANEAIISALMKVIAPYPISAPVADIASKALSHAGLETMRGAVDVLNVEKQRIASALSKHNGIELVGNTAANFVLFRTTYAKQLMAALQQEKVFIRNQSAQLNLNDCLRVSVSSPEDNDAFIQAVKHFFQMEKRT